MGKLRADFGRAYGPKEVELKEAAEKAALAAETVDMTLPVSRKPLGARHPLPKLMEDVEDFFISMGWQISSGPEIEAEWYNFDSLNFGPDHPARQMQDTFYVKAISQGQAAGFVGLQHGGAYADLLRSGPCPPDPWSAAVHRVPGPRVPHR